ncbi:M24 family metallopeptidase [Candidatus Nanosalina sp. VS9-1]|uniref:M24 family metallopeptidase n=1 Tax=Candidatus Nanosalina sp. VS9-1 TaxID=3388566 RepID=UPI0039DFBD19
MEFRERIRQCRAKMRERDIDLLIVSPGHEMLYLSGYRGDVRRKPSLLVIPLDDEAFFLVPEINSEDVREVSGIERVVGYSERPYELLRSHVSEVESVGVNDSMPAVFEYPLRETLDAEFHLAGVLIDEMREIKDEKELENLEASAQIADRIVEDIRENKEEFTGRKESYLEKFIQDKLREYGCEDEAFPTMVASGKNSGKPHHTPGEKVIKPGEPLMLDFGGVFNGYVGDQTRTLVLEGQPQEKFQRVHSVVLEAQKKAIEKVRPGVSIGEIDSAAREVLEREGLEKFFPHKIGHGVGLEIHEDPVLRPESSEKVREGMVFSIEPGVYIEGEFGVRIEDVVVVESDGARRLNTTSRDWS